MVGCKMQARQARVHRVMDVEGKMTIIWYNLPGLGAAMHTCTMPVNSYVTMTGKLARY